MNLLRDLVLTRIILIKNAPFLFYTFLELIAEHIKKLWILSVIKKYKVYLRQNVYLCAF